MGNKTSLDLSSIFDTHVPSPFDGKVNIAIATKSPFDGKDVHCIVSVGSHHLSFWHDELSDEYKERAVNAIPWIPDTHMRDFYVLNPFSENEMTLAQGQVVGCVIIECISVYLRLAWSMTDCDKIVRATYGDWKHDHLCKKVLSADLCVGFDVLHIGGDAAHLVATSFNETRGQTKTSEKAVIILPTVDENENDFVAKFKKHNKKCKDSGIIKSIS